MTNILYCGDCLVEMNKIKDNKYIKIVENRIDGVTTFEPIK